MSLRYILYLSVGGIALLSLAPLIGLIVEVGGLDDGLSIMSASMHRSTFFDSLLLSSVVATASTVVAFLLSIMIGKMHIRFSSLFLGLLLIPLLVPPYTMAYGWFSLLGREGEVGEMLFGFWGVCGVLFSIYLPFCLLIFLFFLKQIPLSLEESARVVTSWWGVIWGVTLPLMRPAFLLSFLSVFLLSFAEISVANFLHFKTFALESFTYFSAFYDMKMATMLAVPMVGVALLFIGTLHFFVPFSTFKGITNSSILKIDKSPYDLSLSILLALFIMLVVLVPLLAIFVDAIKSAVWMETFALFWENILQSYFYAAVVGIVMMLFGFLGALYLEQRARFYRIYDVILVLLFALPSSVLSVAFILFYNHKISNFIYDSWLMVVLALVLKYLLFSTKLIQFHLAQIPKNLLESAQLAGANYRIRVVYILFPLLKKGLFMGGLLGMIFSLRESSMSMMLSPAGVQTLSVTTLTQMANGHPATIATLQVIMIGMISPFFLGIWLLQRRRG